MSKGEQNVAAEYFANGGAPLVYQRKIDYSGNTMMNNDEIVKHDDR